MVCLHHVARWDYGCCGLGQIVTLTNGKPSTVKLRLKELIEKGYLLPKGQGRWAHDVGSSRM
jgi:DNA-binding IclR family transcriptional regulator